MTPRYDAQNLLKHLKAIWFAIDQVCSKKLKDILRKWLPHYEDKQGLLDDFTEIVTALSEKITAHPDAIKRLFTSPVYLQLFITGIFGKSNFSKSLCC